MLHDSFLLKTATGVSTTSRHWQLILRYVTSARSWQNYHSVY